MCGFSTFETVAGCRCREFEDIPPGLARQGPVRPVMGESMGEGDARRAGFDRLALDLHRDAGQANGTMKAMQNKTDRQMHAFQTPHG
ncbi:MAG: hypothetical protein ACT4O2_09430 [Beijerinckiaceae bacterium]